MTYERIKRRSIIMMVALFTVEKITAKKEECCLMLEGVADGDITAGMFYLIPLNRSTVMPVLINKVVVLDSQKMILYSFFENQDELDIILSMNIGEEILEIDDGKKIANGIGGHL